ncbi:MAG: hypothetical protein JWQ54_1922 [Mucilaginibacter sp.]|nr:hypothetical protein [Mucilaginibacter sp.]
MIKNSLICFKTSFIPIFIVQNKHILTECKKMVMFTIADLII